MNTHFGASLAKVMLISFFSLSTTLLAMESRQEYHLVTPMMLEEANKKVLELDSDYYAKNYEALMLKRAERISKDILMQEKVMEQALSQAKIAVKKSCVNALKLQIKSNEKMLESLRAQYDTRRGIAAVGLTLGSVTTAFSPAFIPKADSFIRSLPTPVVAAALITCLAVVPIAGMIKFTGSQHSALDKLDRELAQQRNELRKQEYGW